MLQTTTVQTRLATIARKSAQLVEIRFKPDAVLTRQGIRELIDLMDAHGLTAPPRLLVILPEGGLNFQLNVIYNDHFDGRPILRADHAMALVAPKVVDRQLSRLYFKNFPSPQKSEVFSSEAEARLWLLAV